MKLYKIAARNITRNSRRSILSGTAIAVAALTMVFMFALIHGMILDMEWNITAYLTGEIRLRNKEYDKNEMMSPLHLNIKNAGDLREAISKLPSVKEVVSRIPFNAIVYKNSDSFNVRGIGLDFEKEKKFQNLEKYMVKGVFPAPGSNEVIMGYKLASDMGLKPGDKFTLLTTTTYIDTNAMTFKVSALASFAIAGLNSSTFYAPLDRVQKLVKGDDSVTEILVRVSDIKKLDNTVREIRELSSKKGFSNLSVTSYKSMDTTLSLMGVAEISYDIIALIFFVLASSVIVNTTMMVIYERMREIGTISALGMTGGQIQRLFFLESLFIGILGALAGVIIGIGITLPLSKTGINFGSAMEGVDFEISDIIKPVLNIKATIGVFLYSVVISSTATIFPTRKAARIEPVEALKSI